MRQIRVIAHDIRSTHNVGAILRTAECLGVEHVYLTGYTPYPTSANDERLPHIREKLTRQIHKTALGVETSLSWSHDTDVAALIKQLKSDGYWLVALEQDQTSVPISSWTPPKKIAILLGREVEGIADELLQLCDEVIEIPQFGKKESLNVVQAAAIALFCGRFAPLA